VKKLFWLILFILTDALYSQPDAITNLSALPGSEEGKIQLNWTYPGPGSILSGEKYAVQYSSYVVNWSTSSANFFISTGPVNPGEFQTRAVTGLNPGTTYFFRIWTSSGSATLWSSISNGATSFAQYDVTPPAKITTLAAYGDAQISLNWITPGDDGTNNNISNGYYHIRYTTNPAGNAEMAEKEIFLSTSTPPLVKNYFTLTGLLVETTYYLWIRTSDERGNWSVFSNTAAVSAGIYLARQNIVGLFDSTYGDNSLVIADFNRDGLADIIASGQDNVSQYRLLVYQNSGSSVSVVSEPMGANSGLRNGGLAVLDYDNDGYPDIAATGNDGTNNRFIIFHNNSGNGFSITQQPLGATSGLLYGGVVALDIDNDGDEDLVSYGRLGTSPSLIIWKNDNSTFVQYQEPMGAGGGLYNSAAVPLDYNNDGWMDLTIIGYDGSNRRLILFKNSSGTFSLDQEPLGTNIGLEKGAISAGDYNNDGWIDLVAGGYDGSNRRLIVFKNNNGTFSLDQEPLGLNIGLDNSAILFIDYNHDGNLDLIASGRDNSGYNRFLIFRSTDNFQLTLVNEVFGPNQGISLGAMTAADLFSDGDLDIVVQGNNPPMAKIMESFFSESGRPNNNPSAPASSTATYNDGDLTIYWNSGADIDFSNSAGMDYLLRVATTNPTVAANFIVAGNLSYPYHQQFYRTGTLNYRVIKNLPARTTYYWQIKTLDRGAGESPWSVVFSTYIADTFSPDIITDLAAYSTSVEGEINLTWTAPNDPPGISAGKNYFIHYATFSVADIGGDTTFWWLSSINYSNNLSPKNPSETEVITLTGLFPGVTYYFGIKTADFSENISPIDLKSSTFQSGGCPRDIPPLAPSVLNIISSSRTLTLNWNDLAQTDKGLDFDCYLIYRSSISIDTGWVFLSTSALNSYSDSNLINGLTYYYKILSRDLPPNILLSTGAVINWGRPRGTPLPPENFQAREVSTNTIVWEWQDNSPDEENFVLLNATGGIVAILGENATYYLETNLWPNTSYYRVIKSTNSEGESRPVSSLVYTLALVPENLTALNVSFNSCQLVWSSPTINGAFAYKLLRSTDQLNYLDLLTWANHYQLLYYQDNELSPATTYYYRLYSYNADGRQSRDFCQISVITQPVFDLLSPQRPEKIWLEISSSTVKISWERVTKNSDGSVLTDFAGYHIYFSSYPDMRYRQLISTGTENFYQTTISAENFYLAISVADQYNNESQLSDVILIATQPAVLFFASDYSGQLLARSEVLDYLNGNNEYQQIIRPKLLRKDSEENSYILRSYELTFFLKDGTLVPKLARDLELKINLDNLSAAVEKSPSSGWPIHPYWFNGKHWQKVSSQKTDTALTLLVKTRGKYQLRYSADSQFSVPANGVYPRIITPNGDHYNDYLNLIYLPSADGQEVRGYIYNLDGQLIRELKNIGPVPNSFIWDGCDENNQKVSGGIYIYELRSGSKKYRGAVVVAY